MSEDKLPMFKTLLETLKNQSEETKAMFFADPENELMAAYQEGVAARKKKKLPEHNPYPKPSDNDIERYTKYVCWGEGYIDTYFENQ